MELKINFRYGVADKDKAKKNYYQFWLWQYVKRNQEYLDAWHLFNSGDGHHPDFGKARRLIRSYGFISPGIEIHSKRQFWLIDEVHAVGFFAAGPLTADRILETLLAIRKAQGCASEKIQCNYVLPRTSCFYVQDQRPELPSLSNPVEVDIDEFIKRLKFRQDLDRNDPPLENLFVKAGQNRRVKSWNIPRAVGIWLYDERISLKSDAETVKLFLDEYAEDERLPKRDRQRTNLHKRLSHTRACIQAREVLPV